MPLYEYGCTSCGLVTDIRHGFDEKPEVKCERCGTPLVRRFSAAPIVFKGSGFYVTDSRKSSSGNGKSETSTSSSTPETKTEAKPATSGDSTSGPKKEAAA